MKLALAWVVRALIFLPGLVLMTLALGANELDIWSTAVIERGRRQRAERRREELMRPEWPWT